MSRNRSNGFNAINKDLATNSGQIFYYIWAYSKSVKCKGDDGKGDECFCQRESYQVGNEEVGGKAPEIYPGQGSCE